MRRTPASSAEPNLVIRSWGLGQYRPRCRIECESCEWGRCNDTHLHAPRNAPLDYHLCELCQSTGSTTDSDEHVPWNDEDHGEAQDGPLNSEGLTTCIQHRVLRTGRTVVRSAVSFMLTLRVMIQFTWITQLCKRRDAIEYSQVLAGRVVTDEQLETEMDLHKDADNEGRFMQSILSVLKALFRPKEKGRFYIIEDDPTLAQEAEERHRARQEEPMTSSSSGHRTPEDLETGIFQSAAKDGDDPNNPVGEQSFATFYT